MVEEVHPSWKMVDGYRDFMNSPMSSLAEDNSLMEGFSSSRITSSTSTIDSFPKQNISSGGIPFCLSPAEKDDDQDLLDERLNNSSPPFSHNNGRKSHNRSRRRRMGMNSLPKPNPAAFEDDHFLQNVSTPPFSIRQNPISTPLVLPSSTRKRYSTIKRCPDTPERQTPGWSNFSQMSSELENDSTVADVEEEEEESIILSTDEENNFSSKRRKRRTRNLDPHDIPVCGLSAYLDEVDNNNNNNKMNESVEERKPTKFFRSNSLFETKLLINLEPTNNNNMEDDLEEKKSSPKRSKSYCEDFQIEGLIGNGEFSQVYKVLSKQSQNHFALKQTKKMFKGRKDRERYLEEVYAYRKLNQSCINIVRYYKAWQENGHLYTQMELCEDGTLSKFHEHFKNERVPCIVEDILCRIIYDVSFGLVHLHENGLVHLDIKPSNLLLSRNYVKIGDLGLAQTIGNEDDFVQEGDIVYVSKELLQGLDNAVQPPTDIFSFGLTMLELSFNIHSDFIPLPQSGKRWHQLRNQHFPKLDPVRSQSYTHILNAMLASNPNERPTSSAILNHPLIQSHKQTNIKF